MSGKPKDPNMEASLEALRNVANNVTYINKENKQWKGELAFDKEFPAKFFDNPSLKKKYEKEIEHYKSSSFKSDLEKIKKQTKIDYSGDLAKFGLEIITIPETPKEMELQMIGVLDTDKFIKYIDYLNKSDKLYLDDINNFISIMHSEMKILLNSANLSASNPEYYDSIQNLLEKMPDIIQKGNLFFRRYYANDKQYILDTSLYVLERMEGANEEGYFFEFTNFFRDNLDILKDANYFLHHTGEFSKYFKERMVPNNYFTDKYMPTSLNILKNSISNYKENKRYENIALFLWNFLSSLLSFSENMIPNENHAKIKNFQKHLEDTKMIIETIKQKHEKE